MLTDVTDLAREYWTQIEAHCLSHDLATKSCSESTGLLRGCEYQICVGYQTTQSSDIGVVSTK